MKVYEGEVPTHMQEYTPEADYDAMEVISAGFMQESDFGQAIESGLDRMPEATQQDLDEWTVNEFDSVAVPAFSESRYAEDESLQNEIRLLKSPAQVDWQVRQWDREWGRIEVEEVSPWYQLIAPQIAGTLFGVEGVAAAATFGAGVATRPLAVGATIGGSTAVRELYMQSKQQFRPWLRSGVAVGGATLLSAGGAALLSKPMKLGKGQADVATPTPRDPDMYEGVAPDVSVQGGTTGAARVKSKAIDDIDHDVEQAILNDDVTYPTDAHKTVAIAEEKGSDYAIHKEKVLRVMSGNNVLMNMNPDTRMSISPFAGERRFNGRITNIGLKNKGHLENRGNSRLDIVAQIDDTRITRDVDTALKGGYSNYLKDLPRGSAKMNRPEFDRQVHFSVTSGNKHSDPMVQAAGKKLYDEVIAPAGRRGVQAGMLKSKDGINPTPPLGDELWWPRVFSRGKAIRSTPEEYFVEVTTPKMKMMQRQADAEDAKIKAEGNDLEVAALKKHNEKLKADIDKVNSELDGTATKAVVAKHAIAKLKTAASKEKRKIKDEFRPAAAKLRFSKTKKGQERLKKDAETMRQKVASGSDNVNAYSGMDYMTSLNVDGVEKFQKVTGRTVDARTADFNPDMFEGDVSMGLIHTLRRQNRMLTVAEDPSFGDFMFKDMIADVTKEFEAKKALLKGDVKKVKKLDKRYARSMKDMNSLARDYYGIKPATQYQALNDTAQYLKIHATVTSLGSIMSSVQSEIAAPILNASFSDVMRVYMGGILSPRNLFRMHRNQQADMALGYDISNVAAMIEKGTYDTGSSAALRAAHKFGNFSVQKAFMQGYWTNAITGAGGIAMQSHIARMVLKGTRKSELNMSDLAEMGIDRNWIDAVEAEVKQHATKERFGAYLLNISKWEDREVAERVIAGITGASNNSIIKLGSGSVPFSARENLFVNLALQFKTFGLASTSKWYLRSVQKIAMGDARGFQFLVGAQAMGMISGELKRNLYGGEKKEVTWGDRMLDGFTYGGVFGVVPDIAAFGQVALTGESLKYRGNNTPANTMLGTWGGTLDKTYQAVGALSHALQTGELSKQGIRSGVGLVPYNNQIIARPFVNQYKDYLYEEYGAKK